MSRSTTRKWTRRGFLGAAAASVLLPACESFNDFTLLGYTTKPMYDCNIRSVYVPIFQNRTFYKGLEFDLTRAVVQQIEAKTPFKVISDCDRADTVLEGKIISVTKNLLNLNQNNEVRQGETNLVVEIVWRDLRTGEILSQPSPRPQLATPSLPPGVELQPEGGLLPPPPNTSPIGPLMPAPELINKAQPVPVSSTGSFVPELGQSTTTSLQGNVERLAVQIVSMMESPW